MELGPSQGGALGLRCVQQNRPGSPGAPRTDFLWVKAVIAYLWIFLKAHF